MVSDAKVTRLAWDVSHVLELMPAVHANPFGPLEGPMDVLGNACLYEITQGRGRALVAVRPMDLQDGRRLDVVGLVSTGDRLSAATVAHALDDMAALHNADQLCMCTQRAHLVKGAARHGWAISGLIVTKGFHRVQQ